MPRRDLSNAPESPAARSRVGDAADELLGTSRNAEMSEKEKNAEKSDGPGARMGRPPLPPEEKSQRVKLTHSVRPETRDLIEELRYVLRLENKADVVDVAVKELAERHQVEPR
ncbi:MAG: hypothetical protein GF320_03385 [Armatimonadia bacterium]|nr:hypothetical protein [Armatimonadia bacterium]